MKLKLCFKKSNSIVIYKFKDKLIVIPKLDENEILIERTIMSKSKEIYIIDSLNSQILLIKNFNCNIRRKGFLKPNLLNKNFSKDDLNKFICFDLESITDLNSLKNEGDTVYFDPILITAYDFYNKKPYYKFLKTDWNYEGNIPSISKSNLFKDLR